MDKQASNWDSKTALHRFWILAVSLVITTGTAISPALPAMQKAFSSYSSTLVDMTATIQQIPAFIVLIFSSQLAEKFGIKKVVGIGILIMGISGILPAILGNIWLILGARILFGIGVGMTNSLAITLVNLYYSGDDKAQMLGNRSAFEPIGICIINLTVGILLNISWQVSFLAYGFIFLVFLGFWKVIPEYHVPNTGKGKAKERINFHVVGAAGFCALMTIGMSIVNVLTPSILVSNHMGTASQASYIITAYTISSMLMGFAFGTVFKVIKKFILTTGLLCMTIGTLLMCYAPNVWVLTIGVLIIGLSYPMSGTYVFNQIGTVAPKHSDALANSVLLIGCNLGTAIAPVVINILNGISPLEGTNPGVGLYGLIMLAMNIFLILLGILQFHKKAQY